MYSGSLGFGRAAEEQVAQLPDADRAPVQQSGKTIPQSFRGLPRVADWLRCSSIGSAVRFTSWTGVGIGSRVGSGMGAVSAGTAASMIGVVSMFSRPGVAIGGSTVGGVVSAQSGARASAFSGAASAKTPKKTRGKR